MEPRVSAPENDRQRLFGTLKGEKSCILYRMADGGSVLQTARNYPIDATTEIQAGAVVKLSAGKVVLAAAAETGGILGIAAEFHSGKEDALNLRANGEWIRVCRQPDAHL